MRSGATLQSVTFASRMTMKTAIGRPHVDGKMLTEPETLIQSKSKNVRSTTRLCRLLLCLTHQESSHMRRRSLRVLRCMSIMTKPSLKGYPVIIRITRLLAALWRTEALLVTTKSPTNLTRASHSVFTCKAMLTNHSFLAAIQNRLLGAISLASPETTLMRTSQFLAWPCTQTSPRETASPSCS